MVFSNQRFIDQMQGGKAIFSDYSEAYKNLTNLDIDYDLVIFGVISYSGDTNKFISLVRIAEGEYPKDIQVCVR